MIDHENGFLMRLDFVFDVKLALRWRVSELDEVVLDLSYLLKDLFKAFSKLLLQRGFNFLLGLCQKSCLFFLR